MTVNEWLEKTRNTKTVAGSEYVMVRPRLLCVDGFTMFVQASDCHYCQPRDNDGPYMKVEVGYPSEAVAELIHILPYAEDANCPTFTVYGYVPVELVEIVITAHGGIKE